MCMHIIFILPERKQGQAKKRERWQKSAVPISITRILVIHTYTRPNSYDITRHIFLEIAREKIHTKERAKLTAMEHI